MAVAEAKELVQALAFAHFGVYNPILKSHEQKFLDLFDPEIEIPEGKKTEYKSLLSNGFPFDNLTRGRVGKTTYVKTYTQNKNGDVIGKDDDTVRIVYSVAEELYKKNILKKPWSNYVFLDQNDSFVINVKDEVLKKIISAFGLSIKPDILSSADIYAVNKNKKNIIEQEIINNHRDNNIILSNMASGQNTIASITNQYFSTRELLPISLKLPGSTSGSRYVSIVGRKTGRGQESIVNDDIIDPYTKFITLLLNKKNNSKELIEDLITIHFDKFRITGGRLNWEFPITFNYDKVYGKNAKGQINSNPISTMSYGFDLFAQGYGAGFNGQFTSGKTGRQWVGGAGVETIEQFFNQYSEYSRIISEVCNLREEAFNYAISGKASRGSSQQFGNNQRIKILYNKALKQIRTKHILYGQRERDLIEFFEEFDAGYNAPVKSEKTIKSVKTLYDLPYSYLRYIAYFVKSAKSSMKSVTDTVFAQFLSGKGKSALPATSPQKLERLKAHYVHGQCSWFIMRGGSSLHKYLKKRMFLTIFGVISKKGYKIFDGDVDTKMKSAIQKEFRSNGKKLIAEYITIPHLYLS